MLNDNQNNEVLKNLSAQDFLAFGMHDVAYVRPILSMVKPALLFMRPMAHRYR